MRRADLRHALLLGALAACLAVGALRWPPGRPVLAWCALSCVAVAIAYLLDAPGLYGKRADGTLPLLRLIPLGPYVGTTMLIWHVQRLLTREPAWNQVRPGLYVGRRSYAGELPDDVTLVVDLIAELPAPRSVRGGGYLAVPTLDTEPPTTAPVTELAERWRAGQRLFVHCASGHGRAPSLTAAILLAAGEAPDADAAVAAVRAARPRAAPSPRQWRWLRARPAA